MIGIDPDLDYLLDPQQDRRVEHFPTCGCCGHYIYGGERFYELTVPGGRLIVCEDCMEEARDNPCTVEVMRYGRSYVHR